MMMRAEIVSRPATAGGEKSAVPIDDAIVAVERRVGDGQQRRCPVVADHPRGQFGVLLAKVLCPGSAGRASIGRKQVDRHGVGLGFGVGECVGVWGDTDQQVAAACGGSEPSRDADPSSRLGIRAGSALPRSAARAAADPPRRARVRSHAPSLRPHALGPESAQLVPGWCPPACPRAGWPPPYSTSYRRAAASIRWLVNSRSRWASPIAVMSRSRRPTRSSRRRESSPLSASLVTP